MRFTKTLSLSPSPNRNPLRVADLGNWIAVYRPGYIAGVCNPAFADRPSWWDVLCNIETGKITISKDLRPPAPSNLNGASKSSRIDGGTDEGGKEKDKEKEKEKGDKGDSPDNIFMEEVS